jgi:hypothetical protein
MNLEEYSGLHTSTQLKVLHGAMSEGEGLLRSGEVYLLKVSKSL